MRRFTVLGFTEAELGFVLAAAFAAFGVAYASEDSTARVALVRSDSALKAEKKARDSAEAALKALRDSVRRKSNLTAPCYEKGEPRAPIAEITILGTDRYLIAGDTIRFAQVEERLAAQIARSAALQCKYGVVAHAMPGVDAPMHAAAMSKLKNRFYVDERAR